MIADADADAVHIRVAAMLAPLDQGGGTGDLPIFVDRRGIGWEFEDGAIVPDDGLGRNLLPADRLIIAIVQRRAGSGIGKGELLLLETGTNWNVPLWLTVAHFPLQWI